MCFSAQSSVGGFRRSEQRTLPALRYYAQDLATAFHSFYEQCRVVSEDAELTAARLKLVDAARIAFARTLSFMGMSVPERM